MADSIDVHGYRERLEAVGKRIRESAELSDRNKIAILEFQNQCYAEGMSLARIVKYLDTLERIGLMVDKDFSEVSKKDALELVKRIEMNSRYTDWTKHDYKSIFKRFMRWVRHSDDYPEEVRWIKTTVKNNHHKLPEELLTEEEVQQLIKTSEHPRDKALIAALYESGCRIGELLTLRLKHVQPDRYGAKMIVSGKTGMRSVRLIAAAPYLLSWMNLHPLRDDPDSPVWLELRARKGRARKAINYKNASILLKRLAKRVGIKKRVHPHLFRHSRATHLAKHLTEAQMKEHFGWVQASEMAGIYVHLSGRDVDDALLKTYGLKKEEGERSANLLKPRMCPRCNESNAAEAKYCSKCSLVLDLKEALDLEDKRKAAVPVVESFKLLLSDPKIQRVLGENAALRSKMEELLKSG